MVQMRSWLTVADNSGARRLMCILPLGGDVGSRAGLGDIITASVKEAVPESADQEGHGGARRGGAHEERAPAQGRHVHPLRRQCRRADQRGQRAGGDARLRAGGARTAREKFAKIVSLAPEVW